MALLTDPLFVACWSTGPDPLRDGVFFVEATTFPEGEDPLELIPPTWMRPATEPGASLAPRLVELGLPNPADPRLPFFRDALPERLRLLAGRAVVIAGERAEFLQRFGHLLPGELPPTVVDLEGMAAFLHPHRGGRSFASLCARFLRTTAPLRPRATFLRNLCRALAAAHFQREAPLRQLFARAADELQAQCDASGSEAFDWLEVCRRLLDRPSRHGGNAPEKFAALRDGGFTEDLDEAPLDPERLLREVEPVFARDYRRQFAEASVLDSRRDEPLVLDDAGLQVLERFFDLLPGHFLPAGSSDSASGRPERPGQRALAQAVLKTFTESVFLIADAPTGTGKTLAYLAPLMLLGSANEVRIGVSTYTRALQEQAFFREIPRALELLQQAGLPPEALPRVSLLKGRANYLCGRALLDSAPETGEGSPVARATWLRLALYFCEDPTGDLDGFGLAPGVPLGSLPRVVRQARAAVAANRALPQCCVGKAAHRCAAGVRTLRSERSHLVITNHAFVLARPEFFSYLLADECDHLHEVTVSARSFDIDLEEVTALTQDLSHGRGRDRAPFERLARFLSRLPAGDLGERLREAAESSTHSNALLDAAVLEITRELQVYREWRREHASDLTPEEKAFLLHDFLETGRGEHLATALQKMRAAVDTLDSALRTLIEELGELTQRPARRLRWSLRRPLDLLDHWREGLDRWLGGEGGEADFSESLHYEAVFDGRRRPLLTLKWLLPQKWLGEVYYPSLCAAGLVSATARIRGSFRPMKGYLGLDILEQGTADRPPEPVLEFAGPPTFDPRAALVCVPDDAPPYGYSGPQLDGWMSYVEDFLLFLAERTQGRVLGLFTNRLTLQRVGERLAPAFAARGLPLFWQGMPALGKEEIMERFRTQVDSVLLGLDTFWYGVDFPGDTCQHVVITKLPYGQLDDYLFAQRARMGYGPHRSRIYLPKALAMFRQGCGRLLRNEEDRGVVFVLDRRILEKRHADFLAELPGGQEEYEEPNLLVSDTDSCFHAAFRHMHLGEQIRRAELSPDFSAGRNALRAEES